MEIRCGVCHEWGHEESVHLVEVYNPQEFRLYKEKTDKIAEDLIKEIDRLEKRILKLEGK